MPESYVILTGSETSTEAPMFDLRALPERLIHAIRDRRALKVYWIHEGWVKRIPLGVLRQALESLRDYQRLQERRPTVEIPRPVGVVSWAQARPTRLTETDVQDLPLLHRLPQPSPAESRKPD